MQGVTTPNRHNPVGGAVPSTTSQRSSYSPNHSPPSATVNSINQIWRASDGREGLKGVTGRDETGVLSVTLVPTACLFPSCLSSDLHALTLSHTMSRTVERALTKTLRPEDVAFLSMSLETTVSSKRVTCLEGHPEHRPPTIDAGVAWS